MHTNDFEHLTRPSGRRPSRGALGKRRSPQMKRAKRAGGLYRIIARTNPRLKRWAGLEQALGTESKAWQKYHDAFGV